MKERVNNLVGVTAEVTLKLRVKVNSTWSGDCPTQQVFMQAKREAIGMLENALYSARDDLRHRIAIVGTEVNTIIGSRS